MKYIIIKDIAVLATRDIESLSSGSFDVLVDGAPDGASMHIQNEETSATFLIQSERTNISVSTLKEGIYNVSFNWNEVIKDSEGNNVGEELRTIFGNQFKVYFENGNTNIIPAPLASATELENMWKGITNMLEVFIPFMEEVRNGYEVI